MNSSKEKKPSFVELKNIPNVRRGVVAKFKIKKGTILNKDLLTTKRPFIEIQPEEINKLYNKRTLIDLEEDQPIKWEFIDA